MPNAISEILAKTRANFELLTAKITSLPESRAIDVTPSTTDPFILDFVEGATHSDTNIKFAPLGKPVAWVSIEAVDQEATLEYRLTGDKDFTKYSKGMKANSPVIIEDSDGENTIKAIRITPDVANTQFIGNVSTSNTTIRGEGLKETIEAASLPGGAGGGVSGPGGFPPV